MPRPQSRRHKYRALVGSVYGQPWTIRVDKFDAISEVVDLRAAGLEFTPDEISARLGDATQSDALEAYVDRGVAVLPLSGVLAPRMNLMMEVSGGTSMNQFAEAFAAAEANPNVHAIVVYGDTPGGTYKATREVADQVFAARGRKPLIGVAQEACSGGYWILSSCDSLVVSPSGAVGSIGVVYKHTETSKADELEGRKTTVLTSGKHKADGNSAEPLSAQSKATLQETLDACYVQFVSAVAHNRGVSTAKVESDFGQGKVFLADEAVARGMADRVATLDQLIGELAATIQAKASSTNQTVSSGSKTSFRVETDLMWENLRTELAARGFCTATASEQEVRAALSVFMGARGQQALIAQGAAGDQAALDFIKTVALSAVPPVNGAPPVGTLNAPPTNGGVQPPTPPLAPLAPGPNADAAVAAERERIRQIQARGGLLGVSAEAISAAVDAGTSLEGALVQFTSNLATANAPITGGNVRVNGSSLDRFQAGALDALFARVCSFGPPETRRQDATRQVPTLDANARQFQRMSLMQVAAAGLTVRGIRVGEMIQDDVAEMFLGLVGERNVPMVAFGEASYNSPGLYPNLLSALAGKIMDAAVEFSDATYPEWTFPLQPVSDFKPKTLIAMGATGEFPEVGDNDDIGQTSNTEEASFIQVGRFAQEFYMTPVMMANDDLQGFSDTAEDFAIGLDLTVNRKAVNLLTGNPTLVDAIALFHASHGNLIAGGSGAAPSQAQMSSMRTLMRLQQAPGNKRRLRVGPKLALVPVELETAAEQTFLPFGVVPVTDTTANTFRGKVAPIVEPMLSDASAAIWYALADPRRVRSIVVAFMQGYENGGRRRTYFDPKKGNQVFQLEGRFAAAVRNWRGVVMNTGS